MRGGREAGGAGAGRVRPLPDPPRRVLLALDGTPVPDAVLDKTVELATPEHASITVVSVAKIYGTSLGLPHPGLQPNRYEVAQHRAVAEAAAEALRAHGFTVRVEISKSRNHAKMVARWATAKRFHAVVVADPERPAWRRMLEGDIANEIERRCHVPVHAVPVPSSERPRTTKLG